MIRKKKQHIKPRQIFEAERIKEENVLKERFGLRSKREIWKTLAKVNYFRRRAKELAKSSLEEQAIFFGKLRALGLSVDSIADVLDLNVENLLERRLPTVVVKKGLAHSLLDARQMVVHKRVRLNGKVMDSPSYIVPVAKENLITIKKKERKAKPVVESTSDIQTEEQKEESKEATEETK